MNLNDQIPAVVLQLFPKAIYKGVLQNTKWQRRIGVNGKSITSEIIKNMPLGAFYDAARQVYSTGQPKLIDDVNGQKIRFELHDDCVVYRLENDANPDYFFMDVDLAMLAPNRDVRLKAFEDIAREHGPTGPDPNIWLPLLAERPLENHELLKLHNETELSVPFWEEHVWRKAEEQKLALDDLMPCNPIYFSNLCGPFPLGTQMDDGFISTVQSHRHVLFRRHQQLGLLYALHGNIHRDLSPIHLVSDLPDDEVYALLTALLPLYDPFSLLGIAELALARRSTNSAFEDLAADCISKLCEKTIVRNDGQNIYEYYPSLINLVFRKSVTMPGMAEQPPFWHWLCAFTHAGLLVRLFGNLSFESSRLAACLSESISLRESLGVVLAMRYEPLWRVDHLTPNHIQAEIAGRLLILKHQEEVLGSALPNVALLEKFIATLSTHGLPPYRPGPLEGGRRPIEFWPDRIMPSEVEDGLLLRLRNDPDINLWASLEYLSSLAPISNSLMQAIIDKTGCIELTNYKLANQDSPLFYIALIAAIHRNENLALTVAKRAFENLATSQEIRLAFFLLLIASGAIAQSDRNSWLAQQLIRLAYLAPLGHPVKEVALLLAELKSLMPVENWCFGRAEAICMAACG